MLQISSAIVGFSSELVRISSELVQFSSELVQFSSELVSTIAERLIISVFKKPQSRSHAHQSCSETQAAAKHLPFTFIKLFVKTDTSFRSEVTLHEGCRTNAVITYQTSAGRRAVGLRRSARFDVIVCASTP